MFKRNVKKMIAILMSVLIFVYAFIALLPHSHKCVEADCSICGIIESSRKILLGIALSAGCFQLVKLLFVLLYTNSDILSVRDSTPVGLKVKLSD